MLSWWCGWCKFQTELLHLSLVEFSSIKSSNKETTLSQLLSRKSKSRISASIVVQKYLRKHSTGSQLEGKDIHICILCYSLPEFLSEVYGGAVRPRVATNIKAWEALLFSFPPTFVLNVCELVSGPAGDLSLLCAGRLISQLHVQTVEERQGW